MWLFLSFDLPVENSQQKKAYRSFRKVFLDSGFLPLHKSLYYRWIDSEDRKASLQAKISSASPKDGLVALFALRKQDGLKMLRLQNGLPLEQLLPPQPWLLC